MIILCDSDSRALVAPATASHHRATPTRVTPKRAPARAKPSAPAEADYRGLLADVVAAIGDSRVEAVRRSNALVVGLYERVGRLIVECQRDERYRSQLIARLSADLAARFNGTGWSPRNLRYMRSFALAWAPDEILQTRLQYLPWSHHVVLLDRVDDQATRRWYVDQAIANHWSSRVLAHHIASGLHERTGQAPSNFAATLPELSGDLLGELTVDPHRLDFLAVDGEVGERDLEAALVHRMTEFLTHLGRGYTYAGRQYRLTVGGTDFLLDLLFFNVELNSYVVFELKSRRFTPADAGQLGFYVVAIERELRRPHHGPTIGVLVVASKDNVVVEYSLASMAAPMSVAEYTTAKALPANVRAMLPAPAEFASALQDLPTELTKGD